MPLTGELEHLPIVDVIQLIHSTRKSGTLNVYSRKGEGQLVFNKGYIVSATHSSERLKIGKILLESQIIDQAELDKALEIQEQSGKAGINLEEFLGLYLSELQAGKVWSVMHDLHTMGIAANGERSLIQRRIDHIYVGTDRLQITALMDPLSPEQRETLAREKTGLPSTWHPSDHLPVAAAFQWVGCY